MCNVTLYRYFSNLLDGVLSSELLSEGYSATRPYVGVPAIYEQLSIPGKVINPVPLIGHTLESIVSNGMKKKGSSDFTLIAALGACVAPICPPVSELGGVRCSSSQVASPSTITGPSKYQSIVPGAGVL